MKKLTVLFLLMPLILFFNCSDKKSISEEIEPIQAYNLDFNRG